MMKKLTVIGGIVVGIGVGLFVFGFVRSGDASGDSTSVEGTGSTSTFEVGAPAPDFELDSLSGERIRLRDLRGEPVLLNFWATWCGPCRQEMPEIQARSEKFEGQFHVVAVNFDEPRDQVQSFVDELGLTFTVVLDPGAKIQKLYRIRGYPTSYFVDAEGILQIQHIGIMTGGQLDDYLVQFGLD